MSHRWSQIGQAQLDHGQQLVILGGFKDSTEAVLVIRGSTATLQSLKTDHKEAHTRMLLHASDTSTDHDRIVIQSPDTDVAVLSVFFFSKLACEELWFRTGVKDKLRFIPIHKVVHALGSDICTALPCFHALTGCDSTSGLFGIGKKRHWSVSKRT